ncbi:MAG: DUF5121 domain-containing protein [Muribaculaceae bacterium]|nr:DUF5121 domain-containing protein [Muribaculaceae bacterium]
MKHIKSLALLLALGGMMVSCNDDDMNPGNPIMEITGDLGSACFGDTLRFDIKASDSEVPLSTIHANLYFDSELVSEQVIRTKVSGETYPVAIYIPYIANIPDGQATLQLTLQNINFTITEKVYGVNISHADYPYLTFVADDGTQYTMNRVSMYNYEMTDNFPADMPGKIVAPAEAGATDEVTFGYEGSEIKVNGSKSIPFTNGTAGNYTVSFNTFTFEGSPFTSLTINGNLLTSEDGVNFEIDMNNLAKGDLLTLEGFPNFDEWWLNPDYFQKNDDGTLSFMAYDGNYRIIANMNLKYFKVVKLMAGAPGTLNADGTGLPWILGENIGYPSLSNAPGWNPGQGIPMAPVSDKVYQVTLIGGRNINVSTINFKIFGQDGWGTELTGEMLTSQSDLIGVGDGVSHDNGNLYLYDGVELEANTIYVLTLDCSNGIDNAILKTEIAGEQQFEAKPVYLNGEKMNTTDNSLYSLVVNMNQYDNIEVTGNVDMDKIYIDPDYFTVNEGNIEFQPISGYYNIIVNLEKGYLGAKAVDSAGSELTLQEDGSGALWLMGSAGNPSITYEFGWTPGEAYCMAQVAPKVYQFTGQAGPALSNTPGVRFCATSLQMKFFWQDGWGGEYSGDDNLTMIGGEDYLHLQDDGNFFLNSGTTLEEGATYRVTVDLTEGRSAGTFNFVKH